MEQFQGASASADRATAVEPVPVSPLRDGIPSAGHTPGPYDCVDRTIYRLDETGTCNRFVAQVQGGYVSRPQGWDLGEHTSEAELLAVARLFAAAPDLLEALEAFVAGDSADDIDTRYENARQAIAKARGEA